MDQKHNRKKLTLLLILLLILTLTPQTTSAQPDPTSWIAYIGTDHNVWLIHPDRSHNHPITHNAIDTRLLHQSYQNPQWSPDGTHLAFIQTTNQKNNLIIYHLTTQSIIGEIENVETKYTWSPDSQTIIFTPQIISILEQPYEHLSIWCEAGFEPNPGFLTYNLSTQQTTPFFDYAKQNPMINPNISPDGNYLIFETKIPNFSNNYNQNIVDLHNNQKITPLENTLNDCIWTNDSQNIICGSWLRNDWTESNVPLFVYDLNGNVIDQIYGSANYIFNPLLSPDQTQIFYYIADYISAGIGDGPCSGGQTANEPILIEMQDLTTHQTQFIGPGDLENLSPDQNYLLISPINKYYASTKSNISILNLQTLAITDLASGVEAQWQPSP